ncbi:MAG: hypothetical protein HWE07_00100 [Cytophagia bacterium]|nr:hypothetical protein [Cytophagia bacterium]
MKDYFIFQYEDVVSTSSSLRVTVIFIHQTSIQSQNTLAQEINTFFQENSLTDKMVVILPKYLDEDSLVFFREGRDATFARLPGKSPEYFENNLIIYRFDLSGKLELQYGKKPKNEAKFKSHLLRSGSTLIFQKNGGLVESSPDHHFVFPSRKHCAKFIRTGNVLIHQCEIFFLSFQLLRHFENRSIIYCDTSSINVLPYAVFEILRRFQFQFECPIVNSFESYEVFETNNESFPPEALILISSSTSGNIIDRILKEQRAEKSQIQVIFFLGSNENFIKHSTNIICNLTQDEAFPLGEKIFETYANSDKCRLCSNHSRPIHIRSDVFLTVQPKIEEHLLTIKPEYAPKHISPFIQRFRGYSKKDSVIKVFYKGNNANADYEIYFDLSYLIQNIKKFPKFQESLNRNIDKYIPANTNYLLYLPDVGSEKMVDYILSRIPKELKPTKIKLDQGFINKITHDQGAVVIVASCITSGKKLLQISRLMRNRENLNLVYFVGILRTISDNFSKDLINDLKKGKNKNDERPFVSVESISCSIQQVGTSWEMEKIFFEEMIGTIDEITDKTLYDFINERLDILRENKSNRGLSENVFLKKPDGRSLILRKNFAFWNFDDYSEENVSQSEVYFTISSIINHLENQEITRPPSLKQSNYVRNLLSPRNFHRFNDGIIQAALLRSGRPEHFAYNLDREVSLKMKGFLISIIDKWDSEDGEALLEFIVAIGLKKLKLKIEDMKEVLSCAKNCTSEVISGIAEYTFKKLFETSEPL